LPEENESQHQDGSWTKKSACKGLPADWFYPAHEEEGSRGPLPIDQLVKNEIICTFCSTCPVREQCLDYAMDNLEDHGIWGGVMPAVRKRLYDRVLIDEMNDEGEIVQAKRRVPKDRNTIREAQQASVEKNLKLYNRHSHLHDKAYLSDIRYMVVKKLLNIKRPKQKPQENEEPAQVVQMPIKKICYEQLNLLECRLPYIEEPELIEL
jgi:WhiB family redox-sensing transcriptional regulator